MSSVKCRIVAWVDDAFPGWVRAELTDIDGRVWSFVDKVPVIGPYPHTIVASTALPAVGSIGCEVRGRRTLPDGRQVVTVDTTKPDGVESEEGETVFDVDAADVVV